MLLRRAKQRSAPSALILVCLGGTALVAAPAAADGPDGGKARAGRAGTKPARARPHDGAPRLAKIRADRVEERRAGHESDDESLSVGLPNAGALLNGERMPRSDRWKVKEPGNAWGTRETIEALTRCIDAVHEAFPDTPPLVIGHISAKRGGPLRPHVSHQAGRDVDLGYYYQGGEAPWYTPAGAHNLDVPRTWALVRAFITEADTELILIDRKLQKLLREHALAIGESAEWLEDVFEGRPPERRALIQHEPGHATHLHVRFYSPKAQNRAREQYDRLLARGLIRPAVYHVEHSVRRGETLIRIAKAYGTTVKDIQKANGLRSSLIVAGRSYKIPRKGHVAPVRGRLSLPPRLLPPGHASEKEDAATMQALRQLEDSLKDAGLGNGVASAGPDSPDGSGVERDGASVAEPGLPEAGTAAEAEAAADGDAPEHAGVAVETDTPDDDAADATGFEPGPSGEGPR